MKSGLPGLLPPPVPYKDKEVLRPLRESSVHPPSVNRERPENSDVKEPELVTNQTEFNVVLDRWFGELALENNVRTEIEGPRGLFMKGRLATIFGSDLPVVDEATINAI